MKDFPSPYSLSVWDLEDALEATYNVSLVVVPVLPVAILTGFNDGGYDWPFVNRRVEMYDMQEGKKLHEFMKTHMSTIPYTASKGRTGRVWENVPGIKQERREQGKTAPKLTRDRDPEWLVYQDQILSIYESKPDTTLAELKEELGTDLSVSTLCVALKALKLTFKKKSSELQSKTAKT